MLYAMIIKDISGRSSNHTIEETTQLLSHEKGDKLSTPRQEVLNSGKNNSDEILDVKCEKIQVYGKEIGAMTLSGRRINWRWDGRYWTAGAR